MDIPIRKSDEELSDIVAINVIKGQTKPTCPLLHCLNMADNWKCYERYDTCSFYRAYETQMERERINVIKAKRGYQK